MANIIDITAGLEQLVEKLQTKAVGSGENLDEVITAQDNLITEIQTALQGKAAGGSSSGTEIETCTVVINRSVSIEAIFAQTYVNGAFSYAAGIKSVEAYKGSVDLSQTTITIPKVVCGSLISIINVAEIQGESSTNADLQTDIMSAFYTGAPSYRTLSYVITAGAEETATISVWDDD